MAGCGIPAGRSCARLGRETTCGPITPRYERRGVGAYCRHGFNGVSFVRRCAVWSLFADSNQTASLRNVAYDGKKFQIINHFFPFKVSVVKKWKISDSEITGSLARDTADRFVSNWLAEQKLDAECGEILEAGREIYQAFYRDFKDLPTSRFKVEHWDAGWWQVKKCLVEAGLDGERFKQVEKLKKKIGAKISDEAMELGIISAT